MHQKKAISPIISIIIILLITIAIAGAGYSYISVYWTGLMSKQIEILPPYCTNNKAAITLRNIGTSEINNSDHEAMIGLFEPDNDTVGMWHLDETDGNATLDSSGQGNTGTIFGNTVLLMHFEEDGNATYDSTSYGNTGSLYGNTVLLMHFDNGSGATANDETSYGNEGTLQGDLETSGWRSTGCKSGSCLEFDGAGDYIDVAEEYDFNSDDEFSVSLWFNSVLGTTYVQEIIGKSRATANSWALFYRGSDGLVVFETNGDNILRRSAAIGGVSINEWHYITATYSNTALKLYVDSVLKNSNTYVDSGNFDNNNFAIGRKPGSTAYFNGILDEVAIYSKALSQDEVETLYEAGRAKFIERKPGRSGNGIEFDGVDDYIDAGTPASLDINSSFTASAWVKTIDEDDTYQGIFIKAEADSPESLGNQGWELIYRSNTAAFRFLIQDENEVWSLIQSLPVGSIEAWHHIVGVYDDENDDMILYIDGIEKASNTSAVFSSINASSRNFKIGTMSGNSFNGSIDEVAIYSRALTGEEINASYQAGKAKFIEHVPGRYGNAMEFDGDGDYIDVSLALGNNTWSIGLWAKSNDNSPTGHGTRCFGGCTPRLYLMGSAMSYGSGTYGEATLNVNTGISDYNTWNHWVYQFNGSSIKIFVNGELRGNKSRSAENLVSPIYFGRGPNEYFNGTIDEVLIFNRSLSATEIQAQVKPACSCSGNTCQCGGLTVTRTYGEGYFHPFFDNGTFSPGQSLTMTDYNCLGGRCEYRITLPAGSTEATVFCS